MQYRNNLTILFLYQSARSSKEEQPTCFYYLSFGWSLYVYFIFITAYSAAPYIMRSHSLFRTYYFVCTKLESQNSLCDGVLVNSSNVRKLYQSTCFTIHNSFFITNQLYSRRTHIQNDCIFSYHIFYYYIACKKYKIAALPNFFFVINTFFLFNVNL